MNTNVRYDHFNGISTLQDQVNSLVNETIFRGQGEESALTTWAPAVDIYETPNELVVKADLPDVNEKDIDVRVENNLLTIRGERKFEKSVSEERSEEHTSELQSHLNIVCRLLLYKKKH